MNNLLKACGLILLSFLFVQNSYAQTITSPSVPETSAGTTPSLNTMNCDMVECPMYSNNLLKAVVWDDWVNAGSNLFIEFNGTAVATLNIANGYWPDVVIGDNMNNIGNVYRIAVVYLVYGSSGTPSQVYLQPYDVDLSTAPITVTMPTGPVLLSDPTGGAGKYPHIDLFADMNNQIMGLPSLHKYVACWEVGPYTAVVGDINNLASPPLTLAGIPSSGSFPDVAALTDPSGSDSACFIYSLYPSSIYIDTWDVTGATPIPGSSNLAGTGAQPRIEAMNVYDGISTEYQAVYTSSAGIETYNYSSGSAVYYGTSMSPEFPVVAAGIGNSGTPANIGNTQYTYSFFRYGSSDILAQDIDVTTGLPTTSTDFWQVNYSSSPSTGGGTEAQHALSSSSNSGKGLLSCYYDGSDIYYKVTSLSTFGFKTTTINKIDLKTGFSIYPNPATDYININAPAGYTLTITDATGKIYMQAKSTGRPLDIAAFAPGLYFVDAHDNNNRQVLKFIKQ